MARYGYRVYAVSCEACAREYLTTTKQSIWFSTLCGYCVARKQLERRTHPEDVRETRLNLSRWLSTQAAYLRQYAFQEAESPVDPAAIAQIDVVGFDDDMPF